MDENPLKDTVFPARLALKTKKESESHVSLFQCVTACHRFKHGID